MEIFLCISNNFTTFAPAKDKIIFYTMKKIIISLFSLLCVLSTSHAKDVGVPAQCEDVMLQVFYSIYLEEGMAIDEVQVPSATPQKFIQDGQMYIQRDGKIYDMTGRIIK